MEQCGDDEWISVILPVRNAEKWLDECFQSIYDQDLPAQLSLEVSVFNDGSSDLSQAIIEEWQGRFAGKPNTRLVLNSSYGHDSHDHDQLHVCDSMRRGIESSLTPPTHFRGRQAMGVGYATNRAILASKGAYLCFQNADDVMLPERILSQYNAAKDFELKFPSGHVIIGSQFKRDPPDSTVRFTHWCNTLQDGLLDKQVYTSHGPTVAMPTWFMSRKTFGSVTGGFSEEGKGCPEDLIFFLDFLQNSSESNPHHIIRIPRPLVLYRFHPDAATLSVAQSTIWRIKLERFIRMVLLGTWSNLDFTIWSAGKIGKRFYRSLPESIRSRVKAFVDVSDRKLRQGTLHFSRTTRLAPRPILPLARLTSPFVVCMKLGLHNFEDILVRTEFVEGHDYFIVN